MLSIVLCDILFITALGRPWDCVPCVFRGKTFMDLLILITVNHPLVYCCFFVYSFSPHPCLTLLTFLLLQVPRICNSNGNNNNKMATMMMTNNKQQKIPWWHNNSRNNNNNNGSNNRFVFVALVFFSSFFVDCCILYYR